MNIKTKTVDVKADGNGSIAGYASTWTRTPDAYGDVVARGAFAESIAAIAESGKALPLLWNHDSGDLAAYIGTVTELAEDNHGLYFEADFDATPEAQRARELAADGRLCKFSFAYDILDQMEVELDDGTKANELRKLNIHEVSLVLYPANRDTSVVEVKAAPVDVPVKREVIAAVAKAVEDATGFAVQGLEVKSEPDALPEVTIRAVAYGGFKAGRRNSKADADALREILDSCRDAAEELARIQTIVNGLLDGEDPAAPDEQEPGTEAGYAEANAEEPDTANAEEPEAKAAEVDALLQQASKLLEGEV